MTDKEWIEDHIDEAYKIISDTLVGKDEKIDKSYRSYFSSFGGAVIMGTVESAICGFWSTTGDQGGKDTTANKPKVVECIYRLLGGDKKNLFNEIIEKKQGEELINTFRALKEVNWENDILKKDSVLNAAAAMKIACDLFERK